MTHVPENLHDLSSKFDVLGCYDLASFFSRPSSDLFKILQKLKKDVFEDRERLIFYLFDEVGPALIKDLMNNLGNCLVDIDFPGFFIIIVTDQNLPALPDPDITVIKLSPPTGYVAKNITKSTALLDPPQIICALPWSSLNITSQGKFSPCNQFNGAISREDGTYFDPKKDSIEDVYNSTYMKSLRQVFRDGTRIKACAKCWKDEDSGVPSKRQLHLERKDIGRSVNWEEDSVDNLKLISIALGNRCTQKCRICDPTVSSSIAEEIISSIPVDRQENNPYQILLKNGSWINDSENFWKDLVDHTQIQHFDFSGGEPLLDENHFYMLKTMVKRGLAQDISIRYITNLFYLPEQILEVWKKFKSVDLSISIDDINERFDYQRYGEYSWENLEENIKTIKKEKPSNVIISSSTMVHAMNVYYLPDLCHWLDSADFDDYYFGILHTPACYNISKMPDSLKTLVLDRLSSAKLDKKFQPFINNIASVIKNSKKENETMLSSAIRDLDKIRGQNFADAHPEVAKAIGYSI